MTCSIRASILKVAVASVVLAAGTAVFAQSVHAQDRAKPTAIATQQAGSVGNSLSAGSAGRQTAGSATCSPAGSTMCQKFTAGCDKVGGGLSSSPDGGVTCSVASTKVGGMKRTLRTSALQLRRGAGASGDDSTCESDGSADGNAICAGFGSACGTLGCGPSTNPDGSVGCSCQ